MKYLILAILLAGCSVDKSKTTNDYSVDYVYTDYGDGIVMRCDDNNGTNCIIYTYDEDYNDVNNTDTNVSG